PRPHVYGNTDTERARTKVGKLTKHALETTAERQAGIASVTQPDDRANVRVSDGKRLILRRSSGWQRKHGCRENQRADAVFHVKRGERVLISPLLQAAVKERPKRCDVKHEFAGRAYLNSSSFPRNGSRGFSAWRACSSCSRTARGPVPPATSRCLMDVSGINASPTSSPNSG